MLVPFLRRTFSVENALSNGIWGLVYALVYAAMGALVPVVLHAATSLSWPWLVVVGLAVFCLLLAGTLAVWARHSGAERSKKDVPRKEKPAKPTTSASRPEKEHPRMHESAARTSEPGVKTNLEPATTDAPEPAGGLKGALEKEQGHGQTILNALKTPGFAPLWQYENPPTASDVEPWKVSVDHILRNHPDLLILFHYAPPRSRVATALGPSIVDHLRGGPETRRLERLLEQLDRVIERA